MTLDSDVGEEYAEHLEKAIMMMKGVVNVDKSVANYEDHMNRSRIISEMREKLYKFMQDEMSL